MNFQAGFQAVPFNSGGVLGWNPPFIKWGGFGSTSPFIKWGGFRAFSLRGKTPPLNEGGAFQNAPPSNYGDKRSTWLLPCKKKTKVSLCYVLRVQLHDNARGAA